MDLESSSLEGLLARLDTSLSPAGLSMFLMGSVHPWIQKRAKTRFAAEGDDVSGDWLPLAQATQEIRANGDWRVGPSHPINRRTGDLEDYITNANSSIMPWQGGSMLTYPDNPPVGPGLDEKMRTAQGGKDHPKTPPRPVIGLNETDLAYVMSTLSFFVETGAVQ